MADFHHLFAESKQNEFGWTSTEIEMAGEPSEFEINSNGKSIVVGDTKGNIISFQIMQRKDNLLSLTGESIRHKSSIRGIALNFTTDLLATCSNDPKICLSSFDSDYSKVGKQQMQISMQDNVRALTFMEDLANHSSILISAVGKFICITDCCSGITFRSLNGHTGCVTSLRTWNGCMFASSSTDKTIRIWDMRVCNAVKILGQLSKSAISGAFSVDSGGRILIRGDCEGNLSAFDISTTKMIFSGKIFNSQVNCLRITNESRYVVASDRTCIKLCDFRDPYLIPHSCNIVSTQHCIAVRWRPFKASFASISSDKRLRLWEICKTK